MRCFILVARRVIEAEEVAVGWDVATVEPLRARPLNYYQCFGQGHVRRRCPSEVEWGDRCYRCGAPGHRANQCSADPKCPLCIDLKRPAGPLPRIKGYATVARLLGPPKSPESCHLGRHEPLFLRLVKETRRMCDRREKKRKLWRWTFDRCFFPGLRGAICMCM